VPCSRDPKQDAADTFGAVALLRIPEPYDFALSTERYRTFGPDLANLWHEGGLYRAVAVREVRITAAPGGADVVPLNVAIGADVRTLLGTTFDLAAFGQFAETDPVLARLVPALRGFRPPINPDPFETLVTSITAQQVSLRSAAAVRNRLIQAFGRQLRIAWEFPSAERLARAQESELAALGFSQRKAEYVLGLARETPAWDELHALADEEVKARLVRFRGLGEWTADWFLARHLARPGAWPAGDLGLVKAVALFYFDGAPPTVKEMRAFGDRFAPFQNLAAHYLLTGARVIPAG
jgi:DNA-3-methyladenine glycosylase II